MKKLLFYQLLALILFNCSTKEYVESDLNRQSRELLSVNLDSAFSVARMSLESSDKPEDQYQAYFTIGYILEKKRNKTEALNYYYKSLKLIPRHQQFENDFFRLNLNVGKILKDYHQYDEALKHYEVAFKYAPTTDKKSKVLYFKALAYKESNREIEGTEILLESLALAEKANDLNRQAKCFNQMGVLYTRIGEYEEAREKLFEITLNKFKDHKKYWAKAYHNIGHTYTKEDDLEKAVEYYLLALQYANKDYDKFLAYKDLGECYLKIGENGLAADNLRKAEILFDNVSAIPENASIYFLLSRLTDDPNQKDLAFTKYHTAVEVYDSQMKDVKKQLLAANIKLVLKEWEIKKKYQNKMQYLLIISIVLGTVLIAIGVATYIRQKNKQKRYAHTIASIDELLD